MNESIIYEEGEYPRVWKIFNDMRHERKFLSNGSISREGKKKLMTKQNCVFLSREGKQMTVDSIMHIEYPTAWDIR